MPRVAVVGHVEWVDFIPISRIPRQGEVLHAEGGFTRPGGGGGVAAVVLAEQGAEVDFFCALGEDAHGRATAEQMRQRGVRVHAAWRKDQPTRRALTLLEDAGERTIVTMGERLAPRGEDDLDWEVLRGADGVYFTAGDLSALEHARAARILVATPRGRSTLEAGPTLDALVFSRDDEDEREWARKLEHKARLVLETRGAEGGVWRGESAGSWPAAAPDGAVRDAYGCGDSFAAGLMFGLAAGRTVGEAAGIGASWGARSLTRRGAPYD